MSDDQAKRVFTLPFAYGRVEVEATLAGQPSEELSDPEQLLDRVLNVALLKSVALLALTVSNGVHTWGTPTGEVSYEEHKSGYVGEAFMEMRLSVTCNHAVPRDTLIRYLRNTAHGALTYAKELIEPSDLSMMLGAGMPAALLPSIMGGSVGHGHGHGHDEIDDGPGHHAGPYL